MKKTVLFLAMSLALLSCKKDEVKTFLGIEDKFTATIDGQSWVGEVRTVKKGSSPDTYVIAGISADKQIIQISTLGIAKGTYSIEIANTLANLNTNVFIASYLPNATNIEDIKDLTKIQMATAGTLTITDKGTKDGSDFISGTFTLTIGTGETAKQVTDGVFTELKVISE